MPHMYVTDRQRQGIHKYETIVFGTNTAGEQFTTVIPKHLVKTLLMNDICKSRGIIIHGVANFKKH